MRERPTRIRNFPRVTDDLIFPLKVEISEHFVKNKNGTTVSFLYLSVQSVILRVGYFEKKSFHFKCFISSRHLQVALLPRSPSVRHHPPLARLFSKLSNPYYSQRINTVILLNTPMSELHF